MDTCELLVAAVYVLAAAVVTWCVAVRCRATVADIERMCVRKGVLAWYAYRAAIVVVITGGVMHARWIALTLLGRVGTRARARR